MINQSKGWDPHTRQIVPIIHFQISPRGALSHIDKPRVDLALNWANQQSWPAAPPSGWETPRPQSDPCSRIQKTFERPHLQTRGNPGQQPAQQLLALAWSSSLVDFL